MSASAMSVCGKSSAIIGSTANDSANSPSASQASSGETGNGRCAPSTPVRRHQAIPASAAAASTASCVIGASMLSSRQAAANAIAAVVLSRQKLRAIFQTALATTATATNCKPCNTASL